MSSPSHVYFHRRDSITRHPPYGLYLDPHHGQHNWTAASSRVILVVVATISMIVILAGFGPH